MNFREYADYEDFRDNFKVEAPDNFNFGFDCVDAYAEKDPQRVCLIWDSDDGGARSYTFREMKDYSDASARYFKSLGIGRGDRVMLILKRRAQFWFAAVGLIKIGAVLIPATHLLTAEDIAYRNRAASVNAIMVADDERVIREVEKAKAESPSVQRLIRVGEDAGNPDFDWQLFDSGIEKYLPREAASENMSSENIAQESLSDESAPETMSIKNLAQDNLPRVTANDDMMLLYFTSGTTGYPKMVAHNHAYPLAHIITAKYWHRLHPGSLHFTLSDTGWAKAVWGKIFGQWLVGAAIFVYDHEKLVPPALLRMLAKHRVTSFCAPPTVYRVLLTADFSKYDLSALEYATSAGEPLNESVYDEFLARTGIKIMEGYGQTETAPIVLTTPYTEPRAGCLGKANPMYDIVLLDADGDEIQGHGEGELCLRIAPGDIGVFMGYYRNPDMTDYAWRGGLYHTGDLVERDADGYFKFIGRADDIIKSAGYRIGPFEVESVVQQHPAVLECAVTGAPDPIRGQVIKASIILREGFEPRNELSKEIRAFVKANAAAYKIPRIIEFVDELPKTISGKVKRAEIRG